jgi:pectinesterase
MTCSSRRFFFVAAALAALSLAANAANAANAAEPADVRVILVGDSTQAPRTGYGDALCGLFKWQVTCVNLARGGRSTKSFRADGSWERVSAALADRARPRATYVLIQFGHNDQPGKAERTTDLATQYPANLHRYLDEVQAAGAIPVLVTPLTRRVFRADGTLKDDLAPWAEAMRRVARERQVALLDLHADSAAAVARMGPVQADRLAMAPAPDKTFDHTHVGPQGAALFARMVARELAAAVPELAAHLAVGALEREGPGARPQLTPEQAREYSYREVLGDWDPLADPLSTGARFTADLVVDARAAGEGPTTFRTVQAAVDAAAARAGGRVYIQVMPGTYDGLLYVPDVPVSITLYGEGLDPAAVRIRANLDATMTGARYAEAFGAPFARAQTASAAMFDSVKARAAIGTPGSAVAWIRNRGFQARNLTIENLHNKGRGDARDQSQAVALLVDDADRTAFENVRLLGFQDTLYLRASTVPRTARSFFHRAYVEGDMDFIFGEATGYFLATEVRTLGDRTISYALAPSTHVESRHGLVFERCRFTHDGTPNARAGVFKLARQWHRSPEAVGKVVILHSSIGAHIDRARPWSDWRSPGLPAYRPALYDSGDYWDNLSAPRKAPLVPFLAEYDNTDEPLR